MKNINANDRQLADFYIGGPDHLRGNAAACYRELHPTASQRTCETAASKIMRKYEVQEYLKSKLDEISEKTTLNAQWVLEQSVLLYKQCIGDIDITETIVFQTTDGQNTVTIRKRAFDFLGAKSALELIGKNIVVQAFNENTYPVQAPNLSDIIARRQKSKKRFNTA